MILIECIQQMCHEAFIQAYPTLITEPWVAEVTRATSVKFGHYQCNSAMKLTKRLAKNPKEIAAQVISILQTGEGSADLFEKLEIAGPGFINVWLKAEFIESEVNKMLGDIRLGVPKIKTPQKIAIDFSAPNTAKEMHVGHLRSTIIGDALARIIEFLGHELLRLNHIGDWGTQFGMLIAYLKQYQPEVASGELETDLSHLMQWYKTSKKIFDEDLVFKKKCPTRSSGLTIR